jgi:hypothetical protein
MYRAHRGQTQSVRFITTALPFQYVVCKAASVSELLYITTWPHNNTNRQRVSKNT